MKVAVYSILFVLCTFLSACTTTVQVGSAFQAGRRALIGGDDEAALGFFQNVAESNPNFVFTTGSSPRQSIWSTSAARNILSERAAEGIGRIAAAPCSGDDVLPPLRDFADGLIPGDAGPLATSLRADAAHRIVQPVWGVDAIQIGTHLGAEPAPREGMIGIAVEADGTAIPHLDQSGAGIRAVVRAGTADDGVGSREAGVGSEGLFER